MRELRARRRGRAAGLLQHRLCLSAESDPMSRSGRPDERTCEEVTGKITNTLPAALFRCCFAKRCGFLAATCFPSKPWYTIRLRMRGIYTMGDAASISSLAKYQPTALQPVSLHVSFLGCFCCNTASPRFFKIPVLPLFRQNPAADHHPMVAGSLELVLGALLLVGLFTRLVAFILAGEMAFAYFIGHMFSEGLHSRCSTAAPLAILFCFCLPLSSTAGGTRAAQHPCSALLVCICRPRAAGRTASTRRCAGRTELRYRHPRVTASPLSLEARAR